MSEKIYYVYRHVRLDTNEVFYVGKGTTTKNAKTFRVAYERAYNKSKGQRSDYWFKIVNKTKYLVEILFNSTDEGEALKKEIEFIKLYGRKDQGQGTLINFCDGGIAPYNREIKEETRAKMRKNSHLNKMKGKLHHLAKPVFVYNLAGLFYKSFDYLAEASKEIKTSVTNISDCLRLNLKQSLGWVFREQFEGFKIQRTDGQPCKKSRVISCFDLEGNFIQKFNSISQLRKSWGFYDVPVLNAIRKNRPFKGFFFKLNESS